MTTYTGDSGDNVFTGGSADDTAVGNGGNDNLSGNGGNDVLVGNAGSDTLSGGDGEDTLYSADGSTDPYDPWAPPILDTGTEADTLTGGAGSDRIYAGYGDDVDGGTDGYYGDYLFISFLGAPSGVTVDFTLTSQTIGGGTITGIENISWVQGSNFDDYINVSSPTSNGYSDFTVVYGMAGNDHLVAGYYTGTLDGGDGNDIVDGRNSQYLNAANGGAGDDVIYTSGSPTTVTDGGSGNDTIYSANRTYGGEGNDTIVLGYSGYPGMTASGDGGDDHLKGNDYGEEWLEGNDGNDLLEGLGNNDDLKGGAGFDVLVGGTGNDTLSGGTEDDRFLFGQGHGQDSISDFAAGDVVEINGYDAAQSITQVGADVVVVLSSADQITFFNTDAATVEAGLYFVPPTNDTITGGADRDDLRGYGGDDSISGGGGDDTLVGGSGSDSLDGGDGSDTLFSHESSPEWSFPYYGNPYTPPQLDTGTDVDTLIGGAGDDVIFAGYGDNVDGGSNDVYGDRLFISFMGASSGVVVDFRLATQTIGGGTITGIENISWVEGSNYGDYIDLRAVNGNGYSDRTVASGMGGDDTLIAGYYTAVLEGGDGNDILDGSGSQYLQEANGGAGNDTIYLRSGTSAVASGGTGDDTYYVSAYYHDVVELVGEGRDRIHSTESYSLGDNLEDLVLEGSGAIDGYGNAAANSITGNSAANLLAGGGGNDILIGGGGGDDLKGDAGDDRLQGGADNDLLDGGIGIDRMYGGTGDDRYVVDNANDVVSELAGEGTDLVEASVSYTIRGYVDNLTLTGSANIYGRGNGIANVITGNSGANRLSGLGGNDQLIGGGGNDVLDGGTGDDRMEGGSGNDIYYVGSAGDTVVELAGEGNDLVQSSISYSLGENLERLTLTGTLNLGGTGNALANTIIGNAGANTLRGNDGNDRLNGAAGNDLIYGGNGADALNGAAGDDKLYGNADNDVLRGEGGNDWLEGGPGRDQMYGGTGADSFVFGYGSFSGTTSSSPDVIHDFSQAESDLMRLDGVDANSALTGNQAFTFIGTSAFGGTAGELRYEQIGSNTFVQGDTNGDGVADFWIQVTGLHTLTGGDFVL